mmetsp:Transcript_25013/g.30259  ORF Transcript_25013/g.30259 Transcript_25013/m.30259 type:complete len:107 (-) Transcript_25013:188-508(-)
MEQYPEEEPAFMCGGVGGANPADGESSQIASSMKSEVEKQLNTTLPTYELVEYSTQVVAGMNYFMKVHVGDEKYIHLRVFKPLSGDDCQLSNMQTDKRREDPIVHF